ncbi:MAG: histidine kinase [Anaerolineae bacterium]
MSDLLTRRIDLVAGWGRLLALVGVLLIAVAEFPLDAGSLLWPVVWVTAVVLVIDIAPLLMIYLGLYSSSTALAFSIFDGLYALSILYLGGSGMFFYSFVPVLALLARFDLVAGLLGGGALVVGQTVVIFLRDGLMRTADTLSSVLFNSVALMVVSLLAGMLTYHLKQEPPLSNPAAKKLRQEIGRLRAASERARAIYEMALMLGATLNPARILEALLEISTTGFDERSAEDSGPMRIRERSTGAVFLFGKEGLYVAASRNLPPSEAKQVVNSDGGVLYQVLSQGKTAMVDSLADDPALARFTPFRQCRSAVCIPLSAGFEIYGVVVFAAPKAHVFTVELAEVLKAVANQGAVALNNAQLYQDVQQEKKRILEVGEEERNKLARDLHDGPTQSMSAIAMRLNYARLLIDQDPERVKAELFKLENLARRTTKEIRTMLFTLRPVVLETQGLKVAVEQLVDRLHETCELPVTIEIEEEIDEHVEPNVQAVAWFIAEEALNNAKKYSNAEKVWVRMGLEDGHFYAEVEDNGQGFDYAETMAHYDERGSYGLLNYGERAALVNGRATIRTALGAGTTVRLMVPLQHDIP